MCIYAHWPPFWSARGPLDDRNAVHGPDGDCQLLVIDDEAARPSTEQVLGHLRAWWRQWGAADLVVRCLPEEAGSVAALEAAPGLQPLPAGKQELPYQWFAELASLRVT